VAAEPVDERAGLRLLLPQAGQADQTDDGRVARAIDKLLRDDLDACSLAREGHEPAIGMGKPLRLETRSSGADAAFTQASSASARV